MKPAAYYNECDPFAAAWLQNLMRAGHILAGEIDTRSIVEVQPDDIVGFPRVHLFAGIGGWDYALRLADWPADRPVWTGSCPCQPLSNAGKQKGADDARHLWPEMFRLVSERRPATVVGEQVTSKLGRDWLAGVFVDLERVGYAVAGGDLCAAGVGAPHIRQRLYWMADSQRAELPDERFFPGGTQSGLADCGGLGDPNNKGSQGRRDFVGEYARQHTAWATSLDCWLPCLDGKARRVEPGIEPLAYGVPVRVGLLRGYGNAIVPQVAAAFLLAVQECRP